MTRNGVPVTLGAHKIFDFVSAKLSGTLANPPKGGNRNGVPYTPFGDTFAHKIFDFVCKIAYPEFRLPPQGVHTA